MLKYTLSIFPPIGHMYRKTFVCLCKQTISRMCNIFNMVHAMSDMNITHKFKDIEEYSRVLKHRETDRQRNRMHKHFSTLLESLKKDFAHIVTLNYHAEGLH